MILEKLEEYRSELERVQDYLTVFGSQVGKKVLWDIAKQCHHTGTTMPHPFDSHILAFKEGERNVLLRLLAILESNPERIKELSKEAKEEDY
jgi:hypothetical protein